VQLTQSGSLKQKGSEEMKALHLINKKEENSNKRKGINSVKDEPGVFMSCCWDFDFLEAKELIGGKIYFHNDKATKSFLGGKVLDVIQINMGDGETEYYSPEPGDKEKRQNRLMFKFQVSEDCREVKWSGRNHSMSWTSGIIDA